MKKLIIIILGFCFFIILIIKKRNIYGAFGVLYPIALSDKPSFQKRLVLSLLDGPLSSLCLDYQFQKENVLRSRLSSRVIEQYSDDSLLGYGDWNFDKGGNTLQEQQRGQILPLLEKVILELDPAAPQTIVEFGSGNGDVIAFLAKAYPIHSYIGVDFSVKVAEQKHANVSNLRFVKGYALDLLDGDLISGDIVFGSSTFILFTPLELGSYLSKLKQQGFSEILLSEPVWYGYLQRNSTDVESKHIGGACWYHNYCGYLIKAGYKITDFSFFSYKHPLSPRPDIYLTLIRALSGA